MDMDMGREPTSGDRYFIPAKMFSRHRPRQTRRGRGWEATVLWLEHHGVVIWCDGDTRPARLSRSALRSRCTFLSSKKRLRDDGDGDGLGGSKNSQTWTHRRSGSRDGVTPQAELERRGYRDGVTPQAELELRGYVVLADAISSGLSEEQQRHFADSPHWRAIRDGNRAGNSSHSDWMNFSGMRHSLPVCLPRLSVEISGSLERAGLLQGRRIADWRGSTPPEEAYVAGLTLLRSDPGAPDQHPHADRGLSVGEFGSAEA